MHSPNPPAPLAPPARAIAARCAALHTAAHSWRLHVGRYCPDCEDGTCEYVSGGVDPCVAACETCDGVALACTGLDSRGCPDGKLLRDGAYLRGRRALCLGCAASVVAEQVDEGDDSADGHRAAALALLHAHGAGEWPMGVVLAALGLKRLTRGLVLAPLRHDTVLDVHDARTGTRVLIGVTDGEIRAWLADVGAMPAEVRS